MRLEYSVGKNVVGWPVIVKLKGTITKRAGGLIEIELPSGVRLQISLIDVEHLEKQ